MWIRTFSLLLVLERCTRSDAKQRCLLPIFLVALVGMLCAKLNNINVNFCSTLLLQLRLFFYSHLVCKKTIFPALTFSFGD